MCCTESPKGMIPNAATAVTIEMIGASANRKPTEVVGRNCSLVSSLRMSASGCSEGRRGRRGWGRSGSRQFPRILRSAISTTGTSCRPTAKTRMAFRIWIHQGSE